MCILQCLLVYIYAYYYILLYIFPVIYILLGYVVFFAISVKFYFVLCSLNFTNSHHIIIIFCYGNVINIYEYVLLSHYLLTHLFPLSPV